MPISFQNTVYDEFVGSSVISWFGLESEDGGDSGELILAITFRNTDYDEFVNASVISWFGLDDGGGDGAGDGTGDGEIITGSEIARYLLVLTGAEDGTTDLILPLKSFQARRRAGNPTYLSVVIPTTDYADEIVSRPNGTIEIRQAYERNGVIFDSETIIAVPFVEIRLDEGPMGRSVVLTGRGVVEHEPKNVDIDGISYHVMNNGKHRYRLAHSHILLNPGDIVTILGDGVAFEVATMSYFVDATTSMLELEPT